MRSPSSWTAGDRTNDTQAAQKIMKELASPLRVKIVGYAMSASRLLCPQLQTSAHLADIDALGQEAT